MRLQLSNASISYINIQGVVSLKLADYQRYLVSFRA